MLPLSHTPNKIAIRQNWDKLLIANFSKKIGKKLDYFGLPGPDISDFVDWKDYLGWKTGIEYVPENGRSSADQRLKINRLQTNVMRLGFGENWDLRCGSLENIILSGFDVYGDHPALMTVNRNRPVGLEYDLHNWDFQGGFGYKSNSKSESKRLSAIEMCIRLQKASNKPFLFLMTFNVRHTLGDELHRYLTDQSKEIQSKDQVEVLTWYAQCGAKSSTEHYRLKAVIPLYIRQVAGISSFDSYCYPPLYYQGYKEHLIHFVFLLTPQGTTLPSFSQQKVMDIIALPLVEARNGNFSFPKLQHPNFDKSKAVKILGTHHLPISKG